MQSDKHKKHTWVSQPTSLNIVTLIYTQISNLNT